MCPEKRNLVKTTSLLSKSEDISDINHQLKTRQINGFEWFSLVFDELTGVSDTAQLGIWIVNAECEVTHELASGDNLWNNYLRGCVQSGGYTNSLKWNLLPYATTDGTNTIGKEKSLVGKIFKAHENVVFKAYD